MTDFDSPSFQLHIFVRCGLLFRQKFIFLYSLLWSCAFLFGCCHFILGATFLLLDIVFLFLGETFFLGAAFFLADSLALTEILYNAFTEITTLLRSCVVLKNSH